MNDNETIVECIYWGVFLGREQIPEPSLARPVESPHVTFGFRQPFPLELLGQSCDIHYIGYADDGDNQALAVSLPDWVQSYYGGAEQPHITISVSEQGKPVNSANLDFESIAEYEAMETGIFGYYGLDEQIHLS